MCSCVRDEDLRLRVGHAVTDPVVAVQHGERQEDRARLERSDKRGCRLGPGSEKHRDAVTDLDAVRAKDAREPVARVLELAPADLAPVAAVVLPQHRELLRRVLVADVLGDVVALRDVPPMGGDRLLVAREPAVRGHRSSCRLDGARPVSLIRARRRHRVGTHPTAHAVHTARAMEWLQVFTIVAALLGIVGAQTTWVIHALQRIEVRLDSFAARVDARFAQVDRRFEQVDRRFEQMDLRFARMDDRFDRMDDRFARLEEDVIRDHTKRISRLEARLD
jgi:hypothetical protein